ncbi:hypothetical protein A2721_00185 [Candidatus Gottesmanbacteria bacterium RIFCSPHIGHO2_01_FULL_47_48]|uniref:Uncharacterized protein n=1 Tax=Candidatus Gottesmanbacteria bacterium RIFCSPHIGHO2_01_FULL_47_48 TaxID=1798381 RepID=A0A1F6A3G3_9BACT|nr:MAG: hypothetical protein A2721_00185 [Candidatus Gottesmanbacteria bacterium RIFCSPHIGHO2_01_FULL_47_48]
MNWLIILSTLLVLVSPLIYVRAILRGQAKPHRTTRLAILTTTSLTTLSLFAQHNNVAIWLSAASALQAIVIFIMSLNDFSYPLYLLLINGSLTILLTVRQHLIFQVLNPRGKYV